MEHELRIQSELFAEAEGVRVVFVIVPKLLTLKEPKGKDFKKTGVSHKALNFNLEHARFHKSCFHELCCFLDSNSLRKYESKVHYKQFFEMLERQVKNLCSFVVVIVSGWHVPI